MAGVVHVHCVLWTTVSAKCFKLKCEFTGDQAGRVGNKESVHVETLESVVWCVCEAGVCIPG